jgi:hypothetical protein
LAYYLFGFRDEGKTFCRSCGVQLSNITVTKPESVLGKLTEDKRLQYEKSLLIHPVNVRVLDCVKLGSIKIVNAADGVDLLPHYVDP